MLAFSSFHLIAIGVFITLVVLGAVFFAAARSGWMRNGYFTLPSVILIVLSLFILFQGLGSGITLAVIGIHVENHPIAALTINGLSEIVILMAGAVLISQAARQNLFAVFRLEGIHETPLAAYVLAVPIMLMAQIGGSAFSALFERFWKFFPDFYQVLDQYETASDTAMQGLVTANGPMDFLLILLFVAIVPALAEETLFRGFAQTNIERSGKHHTRPFVALLSASLLFAMVHGSLFKLPGLFALGLALGWLTYRTNNLFAGGLAHALNNGFIVAALYLSPEQISTKANTNLVGTGGLSGMESLIALAMIIPLMVLFLFLFNRVTAHLQARGNAERALQARLAPPEFPAEGMNNEHFPSEHE
jgi:membrane protease YdiL (CAAX protease family)